MAFSYIQLMQVKFFFHFKKNNIFRDGRDPWAEVTPEDSRRNIATIQGKNIVIISGYWDIDLDIL